jgi:hypothetical protein
MHVVSMHAAVHSFAWLTSAAAAAHFRLVIAGMVYWYSTIQEFAQLTMLLMESTSLSISDSSFVDTDHSLSESEPCHSRRLPFLSNMESSLRLASSRSCTFLCWKSSSDLI